ncbi:hypothetical protein Tco_0348120 [Tanacetum coccineum]
MTLESSRVCYDMHRRSSYGFVLSPVDDVLCPFSLQDVSMVDPVSMWASMTVLIVAPSDNAGSLQQACVWSVSRSIQHGKSGELASYYFTYLSRISQAIQCSGAWRKEGFLGSCDVKWGLFFGVGVKMRWSQEVIQLLLWNTQLIKIDTLIPVIYSFAGARDGRWGTNALCREVGGSWDVGGCVQDAAGVAGLDGNSLCSGGLFMHCRSRFRELRSERARRAVGRSLEGGRWHILSLITGGLRNGRAEIRLVA